MCQVDMSIYDNDKIDVDPGLPLNLSTSIHGKIVI